MTKIILMTAFCILTSHSVVSAQSVCDGPMDSKVVAAFSNEVLDESSLKAGVVLSNGWPDVYDCMLTEDQKLQVCKHKLKQADIPVSILDNAEHANTLRNAVPSLYQCAVDINKVT